MNVVIEQIHEDELKTLYKLWKEAGLKIKKYDEEKYQMEKAVMYNIDTCFVALINKRIIGSVMGGFMGDKGWISRLAVLPSWQKKGIGSKLLKTVIDRLKQKGAISINLSIAKSNEDVIEFYKKHGFKVRESILLEQS